MRAQCVNNLKQIGLAIDNYVSSYNVLPPGRVNTHVAGQGDCWGAAYAELLPQLEQSQIFNSFNFNLPPDTDPDHHRGGREHDRVHEQHQHTDLSF